jgi:hypothetical protein
MKLFSHNPNVRGAHNYLIVEYMGQTHCAMSSLDVHHMPASQRNDLLSSLGSLDQCGLKVIKFDITDVRPRLSYHVAFQIHMEYTKITIKRIVIDEGDSTCMISLTYWKSIISLNLSHSMTMLTAFDGCSFQPHGIIHAFMV